MNTFRKLTTVACFAAASLLAAACGQGAEAVVASGKISARQAFVSLVDRAPVPFESEQLPEISEVIEIRLTMEEFGYGATEIEVPVGATVRFIFVNSGAVEHEAIVGDMDVQRAQMRDAAEHEEDAAGHDEEPAEHDEDSAEHDEEPAEHDEDEDAAEHEDDSAEHDEEPAEHDEDEDAAEHEDDSAEHDDHDEDGTDPMADMETGDDHGDHGDAPVLILESGASGELAVTFDEVGEFLIGCHIPGHWEANMRVTITVV